jgi:spermidine synthase
MHSTQETSTIRTITTHFPAQAGTSVPPKPVLFGAMSKLFIISVLGLFLELLLIRWVSTEIRIFAYVQNMVLVVCFLGLGMGCWDCRKPFVLRDLLTPLLILVALLAIPTSRIFLGQKISEMLGSGDIGMWGGGDQIGLLRFVAPLLGTTIAFGLMILLWKIFVPVGRLLGKLMNDHPNTIRAYSVNVAGSLAGIWLFVAFSAMYLPPPAWFGLFAFGCLFLAPKWIDAGLLAAIVGLAWLAGFDPGWQETKWSPYQKLAVLDIHHPEPEGIWDYLRGVRKPAADVGDFFIAVNNTGYQAIIDLDPQRVAADPQRYPPKLRGLSRYDLPLLLHPQPRKVLIVGAGSGNDVAAALRNGAEDVVAVEIDPAIVEFGRRYHPEKPYSDPRVRVVIDDARSYFATTTEKFDVIVFGLLDSHTTTAMTNARLDHYVYTRESIAHAKTLLNEGGVASLSFGMQKPFIIDRMGSCLTEVFGVPPYIVDVPGSAYGWGGAMFVTGDFYAIASQRAANPRLDQQLTDWEASTSNELTGKTEIASDDWPYIYLESRHIPSLYFILGGALLALFVYGIKTLKTPQIVSGWGRSSTHFALLGAAFMLLEVQNISKASVVLGNTWIVNAVIISGILFMILLANATESTWKRVSQCRSFMAQFWRVVSDFTSSIYRDWASYRMQPKPYWWAC